MYDKPKEYKVARKYGNVVDFHLMQNLEGWNKCDRILYLATMQMNNRYHYETAHIKSTGLYQCQLTLLSWGKISESHALKSPEHRKKTQFYRIILIPSL